VIGLVVAALACLISAPAVLRVLIGPTLYDRLAGANVVLVALAVVCAGLSGAAGRPNAIDAALALMACVLVMNAAAVKFFRVRTFQAPLASAESER